MNIVGATSDEDLPNEDEFAHLCEKSQRTRANVQRGTSISSTTLLIRLMILNICVRLNSENTFKLSVCFIYRPHSEAFDTHDG